MIEPKTRSVVVVGAGLAGLVSALTLQQSGYSVVLLERRSQVGGLCGTFEMDGYRFTIACNDFGSGLAALLRELAVEQQFEYKESRIFYDGAWFNAAPDLKYIPGLWRDRGNLCRLLMGILIQQLPTSRTCSIEAFVDRYTRQGAVNDLAKITAYFMGVAPYDMETSFFGLDSRYRYGYVKMACPTGGPQQLADSIAKRFLDQGGKLLLNTRYQKSRKPNGIFQVEVLGEQGCTMLECEYLVDTTGQVPHYPADTKRGLPLSMLCLAVDSAYAYPSNTHTLLFYEPGISDWFKALDSGAYPQRFGFHLFRNDVAQSDASACTINTYFYLPRGVQQLDADQRAHYQRCLMERMELMLPDIGRHVRYSRILTPDDFEKMHGLSSRVMPYVTAARKPGNVGDTEGLYYAGHTVFPPGEHAGAAALSGHLVARSIIAA